MPKQKLTHEARVANLRKHINNDTLLRHDWGDGHERACLLAALAPESANTKSTKSCPAEVMPPWLAVLTVPMDDDGTDEAWPEMVRTYADLASRWDKLTPEAWENAKSKVYLYILANTDESEHVVTVRNWVLAGRPELQRKALRANMARINRQVIKKIKKNSVDAFLLLGRVSFRCAYQCLSLDPQDFLGAAQWSRIHTREEWDAFTKVIFDAVRTEIDLVTVAA